MSRGAAPRDGAPAGAPAPAGRARIGALAAGAAAVAFAACLRRISDLDYWTHLALGRAYAAAGTLLVPEPFLGTAPAGARPVPVRLRDVLALPDEWPFDLALHALRSRLGDAAVSVAIALLAAAVAALLVASLPRAVPPALAPVALALALDAVAVGRFRFAPRPEAAAYVLLAGVLLLVSRWAESGRTAALAGIAALLAAWAQLHVTWAMGAALAAANLALLPDPSVWRRLRDAHPRAVPAAAIALGAAAAAVAGRFALRVLGYWRAGQISGITEMLPTWEFPEVAWPFAAFTAFAGIAAWGPPRGRWRRLALVAIAIAPGTIVVRNVALSAIATVPSALAGLAGRPEPARAARRAVAAGAAALAALVLVLALRDRNPRPGVGVEWDEFPRDAAAFVKDARLPEPIFDDLDLGGYLDFAWGGSPPTFVDGRVPAGRVADHDAIVGLGAPEETLARRGFRTIILSPLFEYSGAILPVVPWLLEHPGWRLVRATDALVFVRAPLPPGIAALDPADGWRAVLRRIDVVARRGAPSPHLAYSRAIADYWLGDLVAARRAWAEAAARNPGGAARYPGVAQAIGAAR